MKLMPRGPKSKISGKPFVLIIKFKLFVKEREKEFERLPLG
jgi:hypothetical protein